MTQTQILSPASFSLLILLAYMSVFYVNEHEKAILFRLGEMVASDFKPGLHVKTPIINNVSTFDARVLTLDVKSERFLTSEKRNVIVDSFATWQIGDVGLFYTTVGDARYADIYAKSFGKNAGFYAFYHSLQAYRAAFEKTRDTLALKPNADFFKYFRNEN